ncbi:MAG: hypothetical protein IK079_02505, partial [Desulfovibrio sp.]|nr:hypothetical protein [Desulfovibrio sp.]
TSFAALTSCVSILEPIVADCMELFRSTRKSTTVVVTVVYMFLSGIIVLGYSTFYVEVQLPNGTTGQLLDIADYVSTCFMMPFVAMMTSIMIGWVVGAKWIEEEVEAYGHTFKMKQMYYVLIRYIAPVVLLVLFLQSTGLLNLFFH